MNGTDQTTVWGSIIAAALGVTAAVWRLVTRSGRSSYDGPERRAEMKELQRQISGIDRRLGVLEAGVATIRDNQLAIIARAERDGERWRKGDHQTARELGALATAVTSLESMIAHERGWTKPGSRGRQTPPKGYMIAPGEDEIPDPDRRD